MDKLDRIIGFADFLLQFRKVERSLLKQGTDVLENDAEHSFSLAMLGWYVNATYGLGLDTDLMFKYALAHDLVEVHAGDTYLFHADQSVHQSKHEREEKAARQIRADFPEFPELHSIIGSYEAKADRESRFVYALDKIEPIFSIYLDHGRTWQKNKVTLKMLTTLKAEKVAADPTVRAVFDDLVRMLEGKSGLFPQ